MLLFALDGNWIAMVTPPNQDLYCMNSFGDDTSALLKIPHTLLATRFRTFS
jgi:hypothetical protein